MLPQGVEDDVNQLREGEQILVTTAAVLGEEFIQERPLQDALGQGEDRTRQGKAVEQLVEEEDAGVRWGSGGTQGSTTCRMIGRQNHGRGVPERPQMRKDLKPIAAAPRGFVQLRHPRPGSETMKCHTVS